jgi:glycosyltransferase involved in cell wall biosynthesis
MIISKLLNKKTIHVLTNSKLDFSSNSLLNRFYRMQDRLMNRYIDYISPESESLIPLFGLDPYREKILPTGARFVHTQDFNIRTNIKQRKNIIGYIGRVIKEKGAFELIDSMPLILQECKDIELWIIGEISDQDLEKVKKIDCIKSFNWVSHKDLPEYLNQMKLLVLPSEGEGLPTVVLEAMACGTPVLSTPVGGIPDIITDGITGFILKDNMPETIAQNVIKAIHHSDLELIVRNAHDLMINKFSLAAARDRYAAILNFITITEN